MKGRQTADATSPITFAVVGCGIIGAKRVQAIVPRHRVAIVADNVYERARALACQAPGSAATDDWRAAVSHPDVQAVVVATTNDWLSAVSKAALEAGKHVLVEKPAARSVAELAPVVLAARERGLCARAGFNLRQHPALRKARAIVDAGDLGPLMFIRGRYGHGGRVGYEREWRARREVSGGGELIDQGVHLIDLARWFLGGFSDVQGHTATYFWDMDVEDNAFVLLRTRAGQVAWLHASCTEWKNTFSFEIYGRDGKLQIDGIGGSYGTERLSWYRMLPQMGPPETVIWEYPGEDLSWAHEIAAMVECIRSGEGSAGSAGTLEDACEALGIVERIYAQVGAPL